MRVLILVQSIDLAIKPEYAPLRQAQMETWDSIYHPNVDVIYYFPGDVHDNLDGNILRIKCGTHWTHMFFNLAKAMRHMLKHNHSWDYIFKTDNSTYIDKAKLYEFLLTKPREKYYGGSLFAFRDPELHKQPFYWGDGYALSRDMVAYIVDKFNRAPLRGKQEDDVIVGILMDDVANWDDSLVLYLPILNNNEIELGHIVYRCRIDPINYSPAASIYTELDKILANDIMIMHKIHNLITNGKDNNREIISQEAQSEA